MDEIKLLIQRARNERELGNTNKSLQLFLEIDQSKLSDTQIFDYLGELGLSYFHLKDYEKSKAKFNEGLERAKKESRVSYEALFLRHLCKKEFNFTKEELIVMSKSARELAESSGRKDLVWFDQGVISCLIHSNASDEEINKWFEIESRDILNASREVKDDTALWVWITGMLLEKFEYNKDKSVLNLALILAEKFNLERRKEQILKLNEN